MKGSKSHSSAAGSNGGDNTNSNIGGGNKHNSNQAKGDNVRDNQGERSNNNYNSANSSTHTNNNSRKATNHHNSQKSKSSGPTTCDICAQNVPGPEREEIFAFSKCDHYVCYVCLTRLRVICDQNECPICREKLEDVVFRSDKSVAFDKCNLNNYIYDAKYKIYFENDSIKRAFEKLLKFRCLACLKKSPDSEKESQQQPQQQHQQQQTPQETCDNGEAADSKKNDSEQSRQRSNKRSPFGKVVEFDDVTGLRNHLDRVHKLRLCDLCLTHNKLFSFEYSYYNFASLRDHIKSGEENTSHRGHPECELCHATFFNKDELIQHMSREHYHCHLCARHDSRFSIYFLDYNSLRQHFESTHFLCERGNCRHEQFTSAFDTEIDYQVHLVQVHGCSSGLSRGEARQQRTITLDSTLHREPQISRSNIPRNAAVVSTGLVATANSSRRDRSLPESLRAHIQQQQQQQQQRLPSRAEFPALGLESSPASTAIETPGTQQSNNPSNGQQQFPALPSSSTSSDNHRVIAGPSSVRSFVRSAGGGYRAPTRIDEMDFPPLPEQPKTSKPKPKKTKPQQQARPRNETPQTLDDLINHLSVTPRDSGSGRKNGAKGGKNIRQKPIKIQL